MLNFSEAKLVLYCSYSSKVKKWGVIAICSIDVTGLEHMYSDKAIALRRSGSAAESKEILCSLTKELAGMMPDFDAKCRNTG